MSMVHHWGNRRRIRSALKNALKATTVALEGWDLAKDSLPDHSFQQLTLNFWCAVYRAVGEFVTVTRFPRISHGEQ